MFYVYFLRSCKNNDIYVGSCENVAVRLAKHNQGRVKSTKGYRPWQLLGCEEYQTRSEAVKKERFYKIGQQKAILREKYGQVVK
ncbi:MAG TPA: GIY-YIG nuclease family protein [Candidatus Paceibacterota bacterium]|nr:GIY-YIG nuclease family protein [Candidatus Paceibacterota bacterium]